MSQGGGPPLFGITEDAINAVSSFAPSFPIPLALAGGGKKKKKKVAINSTGYSIVKEELEKQDLVVITKLIKDVVGDIIRDIWLKRAAWQR